MSHRERYVELRDRADELVRRARRDEAMAYALVPATSQLLGELLAELGAVVIELELLRAGAGVASSVEVEVERDGG